MVFWLSFVRCTGSVARLVHFPHRGPLFFVPQCGSPFIPSEGAVGWFCVFWCNYIINSLLQRYTPKTSINFKCFSLGLVFLGAFILMFNLRVTVSKRPDKFSGCFSFIVFIITVDFIPLFLHHTLLFVFVLIDCCRLQVSHLLWNFSNFLVQPQVFFLRFIFCHIPHFFITPKILVFGGTAFLYRIIDIFFPRFKYFIWTFVPRILSRIRIIIPSGSIQNHPRAAFYRDFRTLVSFRSALSRIEVTFKPDKGSNSIFFQTRSPPFPAAPKNGLDGLDDINPSLREVVWLIFCNPVTPASSYHVSSSQKWMIPQIFTLYTVSLFCSFLCRFVPDEQFTAANLPPLLWSFHCHYLCFLCLPLTQLCLWPHPWTRVSLTPHYNAEYFILEMICSVD